MKAGGGRLVSLDVFRGVAVASMILVNAPGGAPAPILMQHMTWHGWTPADLIFPSFLFIVGAAIPFAYGKRLERGESRASLALHAAKRGALLIGLGLIGGISWDQPTRFRIPGVLQRIGLCYLIAALLYVKARTKTLVVAAAALLAGYWLLLTRVPVPGYGAGDLSPAGNLASFVDRAVLARHMGTVASIYDPEGLLSSIAAAATSIIGVLAGIWLRGERSLGEKAAGLACAGAAAVALGLAWGRSFPINKHIYSSSFALLACGAAACLLAALYWQIDARGRRAWSRPFEAFGAHALVVYCASSLGEVLLDLAGLRQAMVSRLAVPLGAEHAALAWAVGWTLLWFGVVTRAAAVQSYFRARRFSVTPSMPSLPPLDDRGGVFPRRKRTGRRLRWRARKKSNPGGRFRQGNSS